jgi:hypothetical protein
MSRAERVILSVDAGTQRALEHLEALLLRGMEVLGRRRAARPPGAFDLERVRRLRADYDGFVGVR